MCAVVTPSRRVQMSQMPEHHAGPLERRRQIPEAGFGAGTNGRQVRAFRLWNGRSRASGLRSEFVEAFIAAHDFLQNVRGTALEMTRV